ncbi:MAG: hypothetical protein ACRD17_08645, partial [Terriglobales bacterium]
MLLATVDACPLEAITSRTPTTETSESNTAIVAICSFRIVQVLWGLLGGTTPDPLAAKYLKSKP